MKQTVSGKHFCLLMDCIQSTPRLSIVASGWTVAVELGSDDREIVAADVEAPASSIAHEISLAHGMK